MGIVTLPYKNRCILQLLFWGTGGAVDMLFDNRLIKLAFI